MKHFVTGVTYNRQNFFYSTGHWSWYHKTFLVLINSLFFKAISFNNQWVENNLTNIHIFCTVFLASWYYADSVDTDVKYECLRILDWLVSTHPFTTKKIMSMLMQWSTLQKSESKFMSKKFYEIDPWGLHFKNNIVRIL